MLATVPIMAPDSIVSVGADAGVNVDVDNGLGVVTIQADNIVMANITRNAVIQSAAFLFILDS